MSYPTDMTSITNLIRTGGKTSSSSSKDKDKKPTTPTTPTPQWTFQPSPYDQVPQYPSDNPWLRVPGGAQNMPINMPPPPTPPAPPPVTPPPATTPTSQWGKMFEDLIGRVHSGDTSLSRNYRTALQKLFPDINWFKNS